MKKKFYGIDKEDLRNLIKVAVYSSVSAFLAVIIAGLNDIEVSSSLALIVPLVNTGLVALKDIVDGK